ncbi:MAG: hypothetical protein ABJC12_13995 [Saprospiraceae bacterium]
MTCCHDKGNEVPCKDNEVFLDGQCYLRESVHNIGGTYVIAPNSYVAFVNGNLCIDTLVFYNDTSRALNDGQLGLIIATPFGVGNIMGSFPNEVSPNEFYAQTVDELCHLNGEAWYANLHFKIFPDSVWMKLGFWTLSSPTGVIIDSATVVFHKKK